MELKVRKDINILKGVALLLVTCFHSLFFNISGGFIGVDIFFVIAGFLSYNRLRRIGDLEEVKKYLFDRLLRILPILVVTNLIVLFFSYLVLLPIDFSKFTKELIGSTFFLSNLYYTIMGSYLESAPRLLQQQWSLSLEVQFYLSFSILLYWMFKYLSEKMVIINLVIVSFLSFIFSVYLTYIHPAISYYNLPTRYWEFTLGAIACYLYKAHILKLHSSMFFLSLFFLFGFSFFLDPTFKYPGWVTIVPVLITFFLLLKRNDSSELYLYPLNFLGAISYPFYLLYSSIHFLCVYRYYSIAFYDEIMLFFFVTVLSLIINKFYEDKNFIYYNFNLSLKSFFRFHFIILLLLALFGLLSQLQDLSRFQLNKSEDSLMTLTVNKYKYKDTDKCKLSDDLSYVLSGVYCILGDSNISPSTIVWGDSLTKALYIPADAYLTKQRKSSLMAVYNGCPPLLDVNVTFLRNETCKKHNNQIRSYITNNKKYIKNVVLFARYSEYIYGFGFAKGFDDYGARRENLIVAKDLNQRKVEFVRSLEKTLKFLNENNINVIIVYPIPENGISYPLRTVQSRLYNIDLPPPITNVEYGDSNKFVLDTFEGYFTQFNFKRIKPQLIFCGYQFCHYSINGNALYVDTVHLSPFAGSLLFNEIKDSLI